MRIEHIGIWVKNLEGVHALMVMAILNVFFLIQKGDVSLPEKEESVC
jgi:hypothetical protein